MPYIPREKIDYQAIGYRLRAYRIASSLKAKAWVFLVLLCIG